MREGQGSLMECLEERLCVFQWKLRWNFVGDGRPRSGRYLHNRARHAGCIRREKGNLLWYDPDYTRHFAKFVPPYDRGWQSVPRNVWRGGFEHTWHPIAATTLPDWKAAQI
jgi:hypothetical protein